MGERNKVQPQFGSELILSPPPEMKNKSIMSENVMELNKLNILRETDLLHNPLWKSEPPTHSQSRLISWTIPSGF